jgi:hypothetical protein
VCFLMKITRVHNPGRCTVPLRYETDPFCLSVKFLSNVSVFNCNII